MRFGKRMTVCVLSGLLAVSLVGCGGKKNDNYTVRKVADGTTIEVSSQEISQYQNNEDWEVFAPGEKVPDWQAPSEPEDNQVTDTEYGPVDPDSLGSPDDMETEEGDAVSEGSTEVGDVPENVNPSSDGETADIPSWMNLVGYTDEQATNVMTGLERGNVLSAWGNPASERNVDGGVYCDSWNFDQSAGGVNGRIQLVYDFNDLVIEAYMVSDNGKTSGFFDENNQVQFWDDLTRQEFATWASAHTPDEIMSRIGSLTRTSVMELLGTPVGYWSDGGTALTGDVFRIQGTDGKMCWVAVGYQIQNGVVPSYVLKADSSSESDRPELPGYTDGVYRK